jgi:succinate dehydrogenase / fumarate reductase membrane anchor subunit
MAIAGGRPRRAGSLERYAWFFMRVSGVILLFIAVFHLLYMHLVIGVDNITFDVIAERWQNPAWRFFDLMLLVFAVSHGTNGMRMVSDDLLGRGMAATTVRWAIAVFGLVLILMGAQILFTFQAPAA